MSYLGNYISKLPPWIKHIHMFLDTASSTNKNFYLMAWAMEVVQQRKLDFIRVSFLLAGHTKFSPGILFSRIAQTYNKSDVFRQTQTPPRHIHQWSGELDCSSFSRYREERLALTHWLSGESDGSSHSESGDTPTLWLLKQIDTYLTGSGIGSEAGCEENQTVHLSVESGSLQGSFSTVAALLDQTVCYSADTCRQRQTHKSVDDQKNLNSLQVLNTDKPKDTWVYDDPIVLVKAVPGEGATMI